MRVLASQTLPRNGMERALENVVRLLEREHDVDVLLLRQRQPDRVSSVSTHSLPQGPLGVRGLLAVHRRMAGAPGDLWLACGVWAAVPALLAALGTKAKVVVWEHSLLPERVAVDRRVRVLSTAARLLYPRAQQVVCVSEPVAATVRALVREPRRVTVIPNVFEELGAGSTSEDGQRRRDDERVVLGCVGSLRRNKNIELALEALQLLPSRYTMRVAGDGPDAERLVEVAAHLGIGDRVEWLGRVAPVEDFLHGVDVLVHPSPAETFGYTLLEAASCGVPVAALRAPVMDSLVPGLVPGALAAGARPSDLADAVLAACSLGRAAEQFAAARARRRDRYDADVVGDAWRRLLAAP